MLGSKWIRIVLGACLFCLVGVEQVQAQNVQASPPALVFIDPKTEITLPGDKLASPFPVYVANSSSKVITLKVYVLGMEFLQADVTERKLQPGEVLPVHFSVVAEIPPEQKQYTGFLVFTDNVGDVLYKTITIDFSSPALSQTQAAEEILFLNESDGRLEYDWVDLANAILPVPLLNNSEVPVTLMAKLYIAQSGGDDLLEYQSQAETIQSASVANIDVDLGTYSPAQGTYTAFLFVSENGMAWTLQREVILHVPSADLVPVNAGLTLLTNGEEPLHAGYDRQSKQYRLEVQLMNQGGISIKVTSATVVIPDLKDGTGQRIDVTAPDFLPQTIDPYQAAILSLNLDFKDGDKNSAVPEYGTYQGYLVLNTEGGQAYLLQPVEIEIARIDADLPTAFERLEAWIQFSVQNWTGLNVRLGPVEWSVLVIVLALVIAWFWQKARILWWAARQKLGPILIEEIKDDSKMEIRTCLSHHLSHCGIEARTNVPTTPIGAGDFTTVIARSKVPEAAFVETILLFLRNLFSKKPGYLVTLSVSTEAGKTVIHVQVRLAQNDHVKFIEALTGETPEEAIKKVAYFIYYKICSQKAVLARIPRWSRFPTFASFLKYKYAEELKGKGEYEKAIEEYKAASLDAPFNALLRQGWGDAYELTEQYLEALGVYLEVVSMWPHLYSFWYRIAVNFSYTDSTWFSGQKLTESKNIAKMFREIYDSRIKDQSKKEKAIWGLIAKIWNDIFHHGETLEEILYDKGMLVEWKNSENCYKKSTGAICNFLDHRLTIANIFGIWLWACLKNVWYSIFQPALVEPGLPRYYWRYIPWPWGEYGAYIKRMGNLVGACSVPEDCTPNKIDCLRLQKTIRRVRKIVRQSRNGYLIYYDATCFYARLYAMKKKYPDISTAPFDQEENIRNEAMRLLKIAERQPGVQLFLEWARIDPDLKSLREDAEFTALLDISTSNAPGIKRQKGLKARVLALTILQKAAGKEKENWTGYGDANCSPGVLVMRASQQVRLWTALNALAADPVSKDLQEAFWIALPGTETTLPQSQSFSKEQGELETCLSFIKRFSDAQVKAWSTRLEESKLYLENPDASVEGVWAGWREAECDNWETLEQKIKQVEWKPGKPQKKARPIIQETAQIEGE